MSIKSLGNPRSTYNAVWEQTAKGAVSGAPPGAFEATGGTTTTFTQPGGDYKAHYFTTSGSFVVSSLGSGEVDILVVGAGGGGSAGGPGGSGGGGGAGAVIYESGYILPASGTYPITIGNGGSGGPAPSGSGSVGGDTSFSSPTAAIFTAAGGGYGSFGGNNGSDGGSGGGGGRPSGSGGSANGSSTKPGDATLYGTNGSGPPTQPGYAGGGGGAGQAGGGPGNGGGGDGVQINIVPYTTFEPGDGRVGSPIPAPIGANGYYWGGGGSGPNQGIRGGYGGGGSDQPDSPGVNGAYGWSEGAKPGPALASNAGANTGGGGGGAGGSGNNGGTGGSGMVIVRYKT